jgi:hypothetical protein
MVAFCFPPLASALAETAGTTIEFSGVKVKRQSLNAPRVTEGPAIALMQNLPRREALITVSATLPPPYEGSQAKTCSSRARYEGGWAKNALYRSLDKRSGVRLD